MLIRTTYEYDIKHSGDEMDRRDLLSAFGRLADMVNGAGLADVELEIVKSDLICVKIHTVASP